MTRYRHALLVIATAVAMTTGAVGKASAGFFIPAFSGNTRMADNSAAEGIVNFAVFQNTSGDFVTELSGSTGAAVQLGPNSIDTDATYVYMYQVVNDNPVNPEFAIDTFQLTGVAQFTSAGYFDNTVFTDTIRDNGTLATAAPVGGASNKFLGQKPVSENQDDIPNGIPSVSGATGIGLTTIGTDAFGNPYEPSGANLSTGTVTWSSPFIIPVHGFSSVFFFTSNVAPRYEAGVISGGSGSTRGSSDGDVPLPSPEPSSLILYGVASLALAGFFGLRRLSTRPSWMKAGALGC